MILRSSININIDNLPRAFKSVTQLLAEAETDGVQIAAYVLLKF